jgi:methionine--tRNA ligase beta chain
VVNVEDFAKLDIRLGTVENVEDVEGARKPIYKLTVDLGVEIGKRTILAGIKNFYTKEELTGRQIACIVNLDPKNIAGVESQGMIIAAGEQDNIALLLPEKKMENGTKVH